MTLLQRIGYYLGGFAIGLVILAFFLKGKKTSFSYGPDARTLKAINSKKIIYSDSIIKGIESKVLDTSIINYVLKNGDVDFLKAREKPCGIYEIEADYEEKSIVLTVENCDSIATIANFRIAH